MALVSRDFSEALAKLTRRWQLGAPARAEYERVVREGFAVTIVVALRRLQETYGERPSTQVAGPSEAVVHTTGKRKKGAEERYEALLRKAFQEAWRVLKPGKYMSVVFGNSSGRIWGLVQRALRDAGFNAAPAHVAILDKGQRSVKGLNSGSEGVVTVDLILTVQKPARQSRPQTAATLANGDAVSLIEGAIKELSPEDARNASHVYARVLRKAIQKHLVVDNLHLGDVLMALRNAGYSIDRKTGLLQKSEEGRKHVA